MTDACGLCMGTGNASRGMHDNGNYRTRCPRRFKGNYRACCQPRPGANVTPWRKLRTSTKRQSWGRYTPALRVYLYGTRRRNGEVPVLKLFRKGAFTGQRGRLYNCNYQASFTPHNPRPETLYDPEHRCQQPQLVPLPGLRPCRSCALPTRLSPPPWRPSSPPTPALTFTFCRSVRGGGLV